MAILAHPTSNEQPAAPPLRLKLADLGGDLAARLTGTTLYLDPTAGPFTRNFTRGTSTVDTPGRTPCNSAAGGAGGGPDQS